MRRSKRRRRRFGQIDVLETRTMLHGDVSDTSGINGPHDHDPGYDVNAADIHIHANLTVSINGVNVPVPQAVGDSLGANLHTHDATGELHIHPTTAPGQFITLGDWFEIWRTDTVAGDPNAQLSSTSLFGNTVDSTHVLKMFVNGVETTAFENYQIHDGDDIALTYTSNPIVTLNTNLGAIVIELKPNVAPGTVANFLDYVNDGDYVNSIFHRSVSNFVIQGGGFTSDTLPFVNSDQFGNVTKDAPIQNEFNLSNIRGTVAMAKLGGDPNSATSEFFVSVADNSLNLDNQNGGFTVFGCVLGMAVPDAINALPTTSAGGAFTNLPLSENNVVRINNVTGQGVQGIVFDDLNNDGMFNAGDILSNGVVVFVDANNNSQLDTGEISQSTGSDGSYSFILDAGTHVIRQVLPANTEQTNPTPPDGHTVTVNLGESVTDTNFVNRSTLATIQGTSFNDNNRDGVNNTGDTPIENATIFIDTNDNGTLDAGEQSTTTAADGTYTLADVPPGQVVVRQTLPLNTVLSTGTNNKQTITLANRAVETGIDFGNVPEFFNSLEGFVFIDANNNGILDAGEEPLAGVEIALSGTDDRGNNVNATARTDTTGMYQFQNLAPGNYTLNETQPAFLDDGIDTVGTLGGDNSVNDQFSGILLPDGNEGKGYNFAERGRSTEYARLQDYIVRRADLAFFNTRFDNAILGAASPTNGHAWSDPGAGWSGFKSVRFGITADNSQLTVTAINNNDVESEVTVATTPLNFVQHATFGDILLFRLIGTPDELGLTT